MRNFRKLLIGASAAVTLVTSGAVSARPWGYGPGPYYGRHYRHHGDGFGNFLLGAGLVGVIAAVASSSGSREREVRVERDDPPPAPVYDSPPPIYLPPVAPPPPPQPRYDDLSSRDRDAAVDNCKVAAEREGERYSSKVRVDQIEDVRLQREGGYRVTGIVAIDHGGYNGSRASDIERARFDCTSAGGRVVAFRLGSSAELAQRY